MLYILLHCPFLSHLLKPSSSSVMYVSPTFFCATDQLNVRQYFQGTAFKVSQTNTTK